MPMLRFDERTTSLFLTAEVHPRQSRVTSVEVAENGEAEGGQLGRGDGQTCLFSFVSIVLPADNGSHADIWANDMSD